MGRYAGFGWVRYTSKYTCMYLYIPVMYFCCCSVLLSCCCSSCSAAACCRWSSSCAGLCTLLLWFIASDSSVFFLFIQTRYIFNVPLGSTTYSLDLPTYNPTIHITHPRKLRACAEPRRATSRRGEAPLVYLVCFFFSRSYTTSSTYVQYSGRKHALRKAPHLPNRICCVRLRSLLSKEAYTAIFR